MTTFALDRLGPVPSFQSLRTGADADAYLRPYIQRQMNITLEKDSSPDEEASTGDEAADLFGDGSDAESATAVPVASSLARSMPDSLAVAGGGSDSEGSRDYGA